MEANFEANRRNKMGVMPTGRLLFTMALPVCISMGVQALYNIVDSIFVSRLPNALTAVGLAYPMQMLMIAVAVGTAVGMNSLISRRLGENRHEDANAAAANGLFLELVSALVFTALGFFAARPFIEAFTDDAEVARLGTEYLQICLIYGAGLFIHCGCERILQGMGKTGLSMLAQLAGAVTNIILDPILIFGYLGFPAMGVAGAAIATVIGQFVGMGICMLMVFLGKHEVKVSFRRFRPSRTAIAEIYRVGFPSIIMQSIGCVMNVCMNLVFTRLLASNVGVDTLSVYYKTQSLIFMPLFGITNAAMSIIAFNYGARDRQRMMRTWRLALFVCVAIMLAGLLCFQLFPSEIVAVFDSQGQIGRVGINAFRIISLHFPIAAFCICASTLFQAIGRGVYSMILSLLRQLFALLPAAVILALVTRDVASVWWAFPIAETISLVISLFFLARVRRNELATLDG